MLKDIVIPEYVKNGIRPILRDFNYSDGRVRVFGADTETFEGLPYTLQIHDGTDTLFVYTEPKNIFGDFTDWVFERSWAKRMNLVYFHKLAFDMPELFYERAEEFFEQGSEIILDYYGYHCEMLFGKVNTCKITRDDITVTLLDSLAFTQASLERSLKMFGVPQNKYEKPKGLGEVRLRSKEFEEYAKQDAVAEYHLGLKILDFHKNYSITPSISLPQFAGRVLRRHFMKPDESIPLPPDGCISASELGYHGGKNGWYLAQPEVLEDVSEIDISSAYPYAMRELPQMVKGRYARVKKFSKQYVGLYKIEGRYEGLYPQVFTDDFKPIRGEFKDIWITSFELGPLLSECGKNIKIKDGWIWKENKRYTHSPLAEFVEHFYKAKSEAAKGSPEYNFNKIVLNGGYGKFAQNTPMFEYDTVIDGKGKERRMRVDFVTYEDGRREMAAKQWRAGGIYNPFIAALICGHARAALTKLEKKYEAFHSATDAVKTLLPPDTKDGLGGYKLESFGRCYAFRAKLYLQCSKFLGEFCDHDKPPFSYPKDHPIHCLRGMPLLDDDGQHLCKVGRHGFKAPVWFFWENRYKLMKERKLHYSYKHMVGLREGFRREESFNTMVTREETLTL